MPFILERSRRARDLLVRLRRPSAARPPSSTPIENGCSNDRETFMFQPVHALRRGYARVVPCESSIVPFHESAPDDVDTGGATMAGVRWTRANGWLG